MPFHEIPDRFQTPPDHLSLTRYFTAEKFKSFIESSSLYLRRQDKFPKEDEISLSLYDLESIRRMRGERAEMEIQIYEQEKSWAFINCWSLEYNDWRKFWEVYGKSTNAVMVRTSVGKLKRQLNQSEFNLYMAVVKYFDIISEPLGVFNSLRMLSRKPSDFACENEVRIMNFTFRPKEPLNDYMIIKINVMDIVEDVIISPFATNNYSESVKSLLDANGISSEIIQKSKINIR